MGMCGAYCVKRNCWSNVFYEPTNIGLTSESCRYLYAVCCLELGKFTEAEAVLIPKNDAERVPNGAAGIHLLGKIYQLSNRPAAAIEQFQTALRLDPLLWCSFEELCSLSPEADAREYLQTDAQLLPVPEYVNCRHTIYTEKMDINVTGGSTSDPPQRPSSTMKTPVVGQVELPDSRTFETPNAAPQIVQPPPMKKGPRDTIQYPVASESPTLLSGDQFLCGRKFLDEGTVRKVRVYMPFCTEVPTITLVNFTLQISSKLFSEPATALKIVQAQKDSDALENSPSTRLANTTNGYGKSQQGQASCVSLLQSLGTGYRLLSQYDCEKAIEAFGKVPLPQYSTGWVLQCVGQAYFEMVDYPSSQKAFQQLRLLDPCRLEGLETYSTVLWHMKKEVELSNLAQEAITLDRHSPVSWCIMGNCFSLQKEHETALRFFQRSLQLDPAFTYAYTLCGHEYFANEDFEKGLTCYRHAIRLSPRHYNAWFGSGHIYFRQEKYGMAEYHFRRAYHINRKSSVLKCYLGMALHKVKRSGEALQTLEQAVNLDPKNPLARFEYASVLTSLGHLDKAVIQLDLLHGIVPKEASVLFQKGKVLKRLGKQEEALKCFSAALDLQPPSIDTNLIKAAIDRISSADDGEDDI